MENKKYKTDPNRTDYDIIAGRILKKLDKEKIVDYESFKAELKKAGRTDRQLLNFFGRGRDKHSGVEKLFSSPTIQSSIKLKGSINEEPKERKQYKYISKEVKHKGIKHQKGKIIAQKRRNEV